MATSATHWAAPTAGRPVDATVSLPGSKSMTNRALILAALATEPTRIRAPLHSRDTDLMAAALRALGTGVEHTETGGTSELRVTPRHPRGPATIAVGNAGTVMRFIPPLATLTEGAVTFDGDHRARERPVGQLLTALRSLGADIDDAGRGALPLVIHGHGALPGGTVTLDASESSQFVSALLLSGARFDDGVEVRHVGPPVPSRPHLDMTVAMLRQAGAHVIADSPDVWRVLPSELTPETITVEPDLSNAAPFLAAALVTGGRVTIRDWPEATTQPGAIVPELFSAMGGTVTREAAGLTLSGSGEIHGIDVDLHEIGELTPTIAAVAALASTPSRLTGIAHLRRHETDRIAALVHEITTLGGAATELPEGLAIEPRPLHGGVFHSYDDHRMATSGAVLGLAVPGVSVENIATTGKTLPNFTELWGEVVHAAA